jgi:hypothetical protein
MLASTATIPSYSPEVKWRRKAKLQQGTLEVPSKQQEYVMQLLGRK